MTHFIDTNRQIFKTNSTKKYTELNILVEYDSKTDVNPGRWQWDSLLNPNKTKLMRATDRSPEFALVEGMVDEIERPNCDLCLDRGYRLVAVGFEWMKIFVYYLRFCTDVFNVEVCECNQVDYKTAVRNLFKDYVASDMEKPPPYYSMYVTPKSEVSSLDIFDKYYFEDDMYPNRGILLAKGTGDGYYPELQASSTLNELLDYLSKATVAKQKMTVS